MDQKNNEETPPDFIKKFINHIGHFYHNRNFTILCFLKEDFLDLQDSWGDSMGHTRGVWVEKASESSKSARNFPVFLQF